MPVTEPERPGGPGGGPPGRPALPDLYWGFFQAAVRGFGGVLPFARRMLVEERRWLSPAGFTEVFGLCQLLPGPNVLNCAIVVGARFRGLPGALAAVAGLLTAPLAVVLALAALYARFGQLPGVEAGLRGVGAVAAGLVLATGLRMAGPLARSSRSLAFLGATLVAVGLLRWPLVPVLLALAPLSVLAAWRRP